MRYLVKALLAAICTIILTPCWGCKPLSPLHYGLNQAKTGTERFEVLKRCHEDAVIRNAAVSYKGVDSIEIEIPAAATSIPLSYHTDFAGVKLFVRNDIKDFYLFELSQPTDTISIRGEEIDACDFRKIPELRKGEILLIIKDQEPWCGRRGYKSMVYRRDAMLLKNGRAGSRPITSYSTKSSSPVGYYCKANKKSTIIENLNFNRLSGSLKKTYCVRVENQCHVIISNVTINTPEDTEKYADGAIQLMNCVDVTLNDITINGTYSQIKKYGYGIYCDNVCDFKINRMYGRGKWGVFGTYSLNDVKLKECNINRFDIHCYGRDVRAEKCIFSELYNQFSSVYGKVAFEDCIFTDFVPVLMESSYNAYTPFELCWKNCTFNLTPDRNYLMTLFGLPAGYNNRPELSRKCLPNIEIENCKVNLAQGTRKWYLIKTDKVDYKDKLDYISDISIKGLMVTGEESTFDILTTYIETTNSIKVDIKEMRKGDGVKIKDYQLGKLTIDQKSTIIQDGRIIE